MDAIRVNREAFLRKLEDVSHGLAKREMLEQSACYVFDQGMLFTYNEAVYCQVPSGLPKEFRGAVKAAPLLTLLKKLPDEQVKLGVGSAELVVGSEKKRRAFVTMEKEVLLPVDKVAKPEKWGRLHDDFQDAINTVRECTGKDETNVRSVCVHIQPGYVEACDDFQICRYRVKSGIPEEVLTREDAIRPVIGLDLNEYGMTENYLFFRGPSKLVYAVQRHFEEYDDFTEHLKVSGHKIVLPKSLARAADIAQDFSKENVESTLIKVDIKGREMRLKGEGASGRYLEVCRVKYDGPPFSFHVSPAMLIQLVNKYQDCRANTKDYRLMVDGDKFTYFASLNREAPSASAAKPQKEKVGE